MIAGHQRDDGQVTTAWSVTDIPVTDATAQDLLLRYLIDVSTSYQGRPPTDAELDTVLTQHPHDDLMPPAGLFLVARHDGQPAGCVGVRFGPAGFAELKWMFVAPHARGLGSGQVLLAAAEQRARSHHIHTMRLDTRLDLLAARHLYNQARLPRSATVWRRQPVLAMLVRQTDQLTRPVRRWRHPTIPD
jgi:GNAT superfamily N-acetyltransferase